MRVVGKWRINIWKICSFLWPPSAILHSMYWYNSDFYEPVNPENRGQEKSLDVYVPTKHASKHHYNGKLQTFLNRINRVMRSHRGSLGFHNHLKSPLSADILYREVSVGDGEQGSIFLLHLTAGAWLIVWFPKEPCYYLVPADILVKIGQGSK